jgi:3-hydroxyisobutyrate dehydrogenase
MKLGFAGLGLMGAPMARRLLAAGHELSVWNRSRDKTAPLVASGAKAADSPESLAGAAEIVMMCVTDQRAGEEVLFGANGMARGAKPGTLIIDFSSIAPVSAVDFARKLKDKNIGFVDAPVSGGVPGAEKGTLVIMAGGREEDVARARPVVMHLASRFTRMGGPGAGQATKLCNQVIVGSLIAVLAEAVRLAEVAGVDAKMLPEALKGGFADSAPLQIFGARMAASSIMLKDLENAAALGREKNLPLDMVRIAAELYRRNGSREITTVVDLVGRPG